MEDHVYKHPLGRNEFVQTAKSVKFKENLFSRFQDNKVLRLLYVYIAANFWRTRTNCEHFFNLQMIFNFYDEQQFFYSTERNFFAFI